MTRIVVQWASEPHPHISLVQLVQFEWFKSLISIIIKRNRARHANSADDSDEDDQDEDDLEPHDDFVGRESMTHSHRKIRKAYSQHVFHTRFRRKNRRNLF